MGLKRVLSLAGGHGVTDTDAVSGWHWGAIGNMIMMRPDPPRVLLCTSPSQSHILQHLSESLGY
jgi:hypothetical protein